MVCVGQEVLGFTKLILKSKVEPNLDFEIPIQFCNPKSNIATQHWKVRWEIDTPL